MMYHGARIKERSAANIAIYSTHVDPQLRESETNNFTKNITFPSFCLRLLIQLT